MIKPSEIQQKAREAGVRDQQIEKDYMLSWILQGIAQHEQLSKTIVFKGGTVLKKIYFEDFRFSEDLDFTLLNNDASTLRETQGGAGSAQVTNEQIFAWFKETFEYVLEEANIRLEIIDNNEQDPNKESGGGINFYITYIGPLGGQGNNKTVKIDISKSEKLEFKPVMQTALIGFSDLKEHQLLCYPLEEVLVKKMRTVMQRMQARDFYDIWYLLEQHGMDVNLYLKEFANKCSTKKLNPTDFQKKLVALDNSHSNEPTSHRTNFLFSNQLSNRHKLGGQIAINRLHYLPKLKPTHFFKIFPTALFNFKPAHV